MDLLSLIIPFLMVGLVSSVFARLTGVNMSMYVLMIYLYMGAKPGEAIIAMLLFNGFTYFTVYSQQHTMTMKTFRIFPGIKFIIPLLGTVILAALSPFLGIVFFIIIFLLETFAKMYADMNPKVRPAKKELFRMIAIAAVLAAAGVLAVSLVPEQSYYVVAGAAILAYAVLMRLSGSRSRFERSWDGILYGSAFVTGLTGIDATDWLMAMRRTRESILSRCYPIVINAAMIVALIVAYGAYRYFAIGALFATIGAALGIRFFGLPEHSTRGSFSSVTLALAVVAALIFMLAQPAPTGIMAVPMGEDSGGLLNF